MKQIIFIFLLCVSLSACGMGEASPPVTKVEESVVAEAEPVEQQPIQEPASEVIYLHASESGTVWQFSLDQETPERFSPDGLHVSAFDIWSGDGRQAYGTDQGEIVVVLPNQAPQTLYTAVEWAQHQPFVQSIAWSPDGSQLAYTMALGTFQDDSVHAEETNQFDGVSLLTLEGERTSLANNVYCYGDLLQTGARDVGDCYRLGDATWSPDGNSVLLRGSHWEWYEFYVFDLTSSNPVMSRVPNMDGAWGQASWTQDSQGVLLSQQSYAANSPLVHVALSGEATVLVDDAEGYVSQAYALPEGIAFVDTRKSSLYLGQQTGDGFTFDVVNQGVLCGSPRTVSWNKAGETAVIICQGNPELPISLQLVSLDGSSRDITPLLGVLGEINQLNIIWGS